jgi:hypothetical protein
MREIVDDVVAGYYSDLHLAAFVTACAGDRFDIDETVALTRAMVDVGIRLTWRHSQIMDKHCVGGLPESYREMIGSLVQALAEGNMMPARLCSPVEPATHLYASGMARVPWRQLIKAGWRSRIAVWIAVFGLTACAVFVPGSDHQLVRGRVTDVWTKGKMSEDWAKRLQPLGNAPALESYLSEYRVVMVVIGNRGRSRFWDRPLSKSAMDVREGDVVDYDVGLKEQTPGEFGDVAIVTKVVCRASDHECIEDRNRGGTLGFVRK